MSPISRGKALFSPSPSITNFGARSGWSRNSLLCTYLAGPATYYHVLARQVVPKVCIVVKSARAKPAKELLHMVFRFLGIVLAFLRSPCHPKTQDRKLIGSWPAQDFIATSHGMSWILCIHCPRGLSRIAILGHGVLNSCRNNSI